MIRQDIERLEADLNRSDIDRDYNEEKLAQLRERERAELAGPEVGAGVTTAFWSDRHAGTVVSRTAKTVTVQRDIAKRVDSNGMSDCQDYEYTRDPEGGLTVFSLRKNGTWRQRGGSDKGTRLVEGRREYYDPHF